VTESARGNPTISMRDKVAALAG